MRGQSNGGHGKNDDIIVITDPLRDRYASLELLSWWQREKVKNAKLMVIGAGALGNEVLKNLALMGVGYIFVADFDTVEDANLSRSVLFRASDNGRLKAQVAAERVKEINPDVKVKYINGDITKDIGLGIFRRMDVVIGCLDNREARLFTNRACWKIGRPWVDGAIEEMNGRVTTFVPPGGACYECTLTERDYQAMNVRYSCPLLARENLMEGKVPTTPTISSIIAGIQTQEALKILHGMAVKGGGAFIFNGLTNDCYTTLYSRNEECQSHYTFEPIIQLDYATSEVTFGQLLGIARKHLSGDAILDLGQDLVLSLTCPQCGARTELFILLNRLTESEARCPSCGQLRAMDMTCTVGEQNAPLLGANLQETGIPALDIVAAKDNASCCYFELGKDEDQVMNFT